MNFQKYLQMTIANVGSFLVKAINCCLPHSIISIYLKFQCFVVIVLTCCYKFSTLLKLLAVQFVLVIQLTINNKLLIIVVEN